MPRQGLAARSDQKKRGTGAARTRSPLCPAMASHVLCNMIHYKESVILLIFVLKKRPRFLFYIQTPFFLNTDCGRARHGREDRADFVVVLDAPVEALRGRPFAVFFAPAGAEAPAAIDMLYGSANGSMQTGAIRAEEDPIGIDIECASI